MSTAASGSLLARTTALSSAGQLVRGLAILFAVALTAAAAQVTAPIPFTAVPFALTPLAVLLTGAALGSRRGAFAQAMYVLVGIAGLPVFAPSAVLPPGLARLAGPTGGYLLAYPLAAFVTGWLAERGWDRRYATSAAAMTIGLGVIFLGGVSWLVAGFHQSIATALASGFYPFVLYDLLKVCAAAIVLPQVWRLLGRHA
jgi:biotin transport system substrate-specific component